VNTNTDDHDAWLPRLTVEFKPDEKKMGLTREIGVGSKCLTFEGEKDELKAESTAGIDEVSR